MAQKGIREFHAKKLIAHHLPRFVDGFEWDYKGVLVEELNYKELIQSLINNSESNSKWVVKPDQLFGKRGKNNLISVGTLEQIEQWIDERIGKEITINKSNTNDGTTGVLTHFLIEPCVENSQEYYLAIKTERDQDIIYISKQGGVEIEENWESVNEVKIPIGNTENAQSIITSKLANNNLHELSNFVTGVYEFFRKLQFAYLEFNPFVIVDDGTIPLDCVAKIDDTADYLAEHLWSLDDSKIEFPRPFGLPIDEVKEAVEELDSKSGASLKLTILNPNGRIWLLTSGGGASVIFADTVASICGHEELGNYGEYSGNPKEDETEAYCNLLFQVMLNSNAEDKVLLIGGGIANFTNIANTFEGIINAIKKNLEEFKKQKIRVYVRRAGINYKKGLELIKEKLTEIEIPIEVYGPETHMTEIIKKSIK
jgi:ATP-citrate lyase beta-subunit